MGGAPLCDMLLFMSFGAGVRAAASTHRAAWIEPGCARDGWGTVAGLVPNHFDSVVRIGAPDPEPEEGSDNWWLRYQTLFERIVAIGERHTATPEQACFAIWEGHGFGHDSTIRHAYREPVSPEQRRADELRLVALQDEDRKRKAQIRVELANIPVLDHPNRAYYLLEGRLDAVTALRYPDTDGWRNPDLMWPGDRTWFIATDVDFWSLYVGGSERFIAELAQDLPNNVESVSWTDALVVED